MKLSDEIQRIIREQFQVKDNDVVGITRARNASVSIEELIEKHRLGDRYDQLKDGNFD